MQRIADELTIFILLSPDRPPDINHAWPTQTLKRDHWGHRGTVVHSPDVELVFEGKVHRTDGLVCDENFKYMKEKGLTNAKFQKLLKHN